MAAGFWKRIGVKKERYHEEFERRQYSLICRKHDVLREVVEAERSVFLTKHGMRKRRRVSKRTAADVSHPALYFVDALRALDGVMKFCFGE